MNEQQANLAILQRWESGWNALHPAGAEFVPYTYDNEGFETDALGALGAWVRLTIQHSTRRQRTMGSAPYRKYECRGRVFVSLFVPIDQGRALVARLADDVRSVLEGQRLGELLLDDATTRGENWFSTGPTREDGAWFSSVVVVEFRYTDTR